MPAQRSWFPTHIHYSWGRMALRSDVFPTVSAIFLIAAGVFFPQISDRLLDGTFFFVLQFVVRRPINRIDDCTRTEQKEQNRGNFHSILVLILTLHQHTADIQRG